MFIEGGVGVLVVGVLGFEFDVFLVVEFIVVVGSVVDVVGDFLIGEFFFM